MSTRCLVNLEAARTLRIYLDSPQDQSKNFTRRDLHHNSRLKDIWRFLWHLLYKYLRPTNFAKLSDIFKAKLDAR